MSEPGPDPFAASHPSDEAFRSALLLPAPDASPDFDARVLAAVLRPPWWRAVLIWARPVLAGAVCSGLIAGFGLHAALKTPVSLAGACRRSGDVTRPSTLTAEQETQPARLQRRLTAERLDAARDDNDASSSSAPTKSDSGQKRPVSGLRSGGVRRRFDDSTTA